MSTHKRAFTRPLTYYSARRGYFRTPMVRKYSGRYQAKTAVRNKYSRFQEKTNNVEQKSVEVVTAALATGPIVNSALVLCNPIAQGVNTNNRVGRRYTMTSFQYRIVFSVATSYRVMVVYDRAPNGVAPVVTDILAADSFVSPTNLATADRFIIVSDKIYQPAQDGSAGNTIAQCYLKMSLDTNCLTAAATIADISTGALWIFMSGVAVSTANISQRLRFTDA